MSSNPSRRTFLKTLATASSVAALPSILTAQTNSSEAPSVAKGREMKTDVLIIGGSLGGIAAALAAARMGRKVIVTEETAWIGGQATVQGIPLDEHPWIERYGRTQSYADFREGVRAYDTFYFGEAWRLQ
jgi:NADPH-dependent 2,4-dienoyl-CoA reductase/sulfur reductase-like enzyme